MLHNKEVIFFIGLPGSGKSSIIEERKYADTHYIVSADVIKEALPEYDPKSPDLVHEKSVKLAEEKMYELAVTGVNICMDSGGVNNSYSVRIIKNMKEQGYTVHIILVDTPLIVCLDRNSRRERNVPPDDIVRKSRRLDEAFARQVELSDTHEVIHYFTNKHVFLDMDGVVAEYQTIPQKGFEMDYVNTNIFKYARKVKPVIDVIKKFHNEGKTIYILSAAPNSICNDHKREWLKKNMPYIKDEHIFFIGKKEYKSNMLNQLMIKFKLKPKDVMFVDDTHSILWDAYDLKVNAIHPSKLLAEFF